MAPAAIGIDAAIAAGIGVSGAAVLVLGVARVLGCAAALVLADAGHSRPAELQWQQAHPQEEEEAAHGARV